MTKALIFGTGAVGCVYGWILHNSGVEVTATCRSNYSAVKENGITINSALFGTVHYQPHTVQSAEEAQHYGPFDYVLVCTKSFPGQCKDIKAAVAPDTTIVIAQNGIGVEDEYAAMYPNNTIISGVVWLPTTQVSPAVINMGPLERIEVGTYPADASPASKDKVQQFSAIWAAGGGTAPVFDDIQPKRWSKLAVNCAFNPMAALTRCDSANLLLSSDMADDMVVSVLREVGAVAAAAGYRNLTEESLQNDMAWFRSRKETGGKDPSMLADVKAGRPIEVEAILGNTVRIARRHAVDAPRLEMLYGLAQALNFQILRPERWKPTVA